MEWQDKEKSLSKVSNWSFALILLQVILQSIIGYPMVISNIISIVLTATVYVTILFRVYLRKNTIPKTLVLLFIVCCLLMGIRYFTETNIVLSVISLLTLYTYFIYGQYILTGEFSKTLLVFGCVSLCIYLVTFYVENTVVTTIVLFIQLGFVMRIFNPTLNKMAEHKKQKRLRDEKENGKKEVSLIRRILFGKSGKLDLSILEVFKEGGDKSAKEG